MRKIVGSLFVFMLAVSLVLVPSPVSAGLGDDCTWDPVKWEDNENSVVLYLQHWGRTPVTAMSRLAGLAYPDMLHDNCNLSGLCPGSRVTGCDIPSCEGGCCSCNEEQGCLACCDDPVECELSQAATACPALGMSDGECQAATGYKTAHCCCCWGISLCFANKSWGGGDISPHPRWNNEHPNHFGNSAGGAENWGGDWGTTGSTHTECVAHCWALQDNLLQDFGDGCL